MQSTMKAPHSFAKVPAAHIQRSSFDRSFGYKTAFDAGWLVPFVYEEILPGDTMKLSASLLARLATPIKPIMDNMFLETFFFFCPYRLIWTNFVKMMGEQANPGDSTSYIVPTTTAPGAGVGHAVGSLYDYIGIPIQVSGLVHANHSGRVYNLTYNQWFRDQNLQSSVVVDLGDGPDTVTNYTLLRRGKRHDYFTSCLPWPQKGTAVTIPLGTSAPVTITLAPTTGINPLLKRADTHAVIPTPGGATQPLSLLTSQLTTRDLVASDGAAAPTYYNAVIDPNGTLVGSADLSAAVAASINTMRLAITVQQVLEIDARGGTRYIESNQAHFGVVSPDARLQRVEFLGGGSTNVNVHPVQQTSVSAATPQGNLAAFGTAAATGHGFTKSFTEHGFVLGLVNVRADLTYQQGLDKVHSRSTRFDHYLPTFANLGEQAVLTQEILAAGPGGGAWDTSVFGYQERWAEMRYNRSKITGIFRSAAPGTLDVWHLSQSLTYGVVALNAAFIVEDPPIDRAIAVPSEPHFIFDSYINITHVRPLPVYSVPGLSRF